jgi:hypothetical protein
MQCKTKSAHFSATKTIAFIPVPETPSVSSASQPEMDE